MNDAGTRCDVWTYPGEGHAFFNCRDGTNPYYYATVMEADRFLVSLGFLSGMPKLQESAVNAVRL